MEFNPNEVVYGDVVITLRPRSLLTQEVYRRFLNEWLDFSAHISLVLADGDTDASSTDYELATTKIQALMDAQGIDFDTVEYLVLYLIVLSPRILSALDCPFEFWRQVDPLAVKIDKLSAFITSETIELIEQLDTALTELDKPADKLLASANGLTEPEKKSAPKSKKRSTTG